MFNKKALDIYKMLSSQFIIPESSAQEEALIYIYLTSHESKVKNLWFVPGAEFIMVERRQDRPSAPALGFFELFLGGFKVPLCVLVQMISPSPPE